MVNKDPMLDRCNIVWRFSEVCTMIMHIAMAGDLRFSPLSWYIRGNNSEVVI